MKSQKKFNYIIPFYSVKGAGTRKFGDALDLFTKYFDAFSLVENKGFVDWGCADGRAANFLSSYLKDFKYFGLEHPKSELVSRMETSIFKNDSRCSFGLIGTDFEKLALKKSKFVLLSSIFTHLKKEDFHNTMAKFAPIIKKGGEVVFSIFIEKKYRFESHAGVYGVPNCISRVFYTKRQLSNFAKKNGYKLTEHGSYLAQGENLHRIFKCKK